MSFSAVDNIMFHLMKNMDIEVPGYLIYKESAAFNPKQDFLPPMDILSEKLCLKQSTENLLEVTYDLRSHGKSEELSSNTHKEQINRLLQEDLEISSSEPDPFETDDEIKDPDYSSGTSEADEDNFLNNSNKSKKKRDISKQKIMEKETAISNTTRKRKRNPEQWKKNVIKKGRNAGKEYTNWKGKVQSTRKLTSRAIIV